ncbi:MAG: hypothetical protein FWD65_07160, partial [Coriobacteriia bacterium]|nr:hypothetical protein [Coriobacteriia bacterium]
WSSEAGAWIPLFVTAVIRSLWPAIIGWFMLGLAKEAAALIEGRYSVRVALVTCGANILIAACAAVIFLDNRIINQGFSNLLIQNGRADVARWALLHPNMVFFALICFALILDTATVALRAYRSDRG